MKTLSLEGYVTVEAVQKGLLALQEDAQVIPEMTIDLKEATHLRIEAVVTLLSVLAYRLKRLVDHPSFKTILVYPDDNKLRDFISSIRLFEVVRDVTGVEIDEYVSNLPEEFSETAWGQHYYERDPKLRHGRIDQLTRTGFHPLTSLSFNNSAEQSVTLRETPAKWKEGTDMISEIQKNMPSTIKVGDTVSKHIIYESITNAIRHPSSDKLVIGCIREGHYEDARYILVIWDNGDNIVNTLEERLKEGQSIRAELHPTDDVHSCFCLKNEQQKISGRPSKGADNFLYFFSNDLPDLSEPDENKNYRKQPWYILLASFYLGVTRDPDGEDYSSKAKGVIQPPANGMGGGRGLTYLLNEVVRNFGGEVRVRTSRFFMNVRQGEKRYKVLPEQFVRKFHDKYYIRQYKKIYDELKLPTSGQRDIIDCLYQVTVKEYKDPPSQFYGNMLTIEFPRKQ